MEDVDIYGWEKVKSYHAAWMNQLEQRNERMDDDAKLKLKRALV